MPKGDRAILKADPEDGTTPIANLLLEAITVADLNGREKSVCLYLCRVTYGWQRNGDRLKEAELTLKQWAEILRTDTSKASHILAGMVAKQIIKRNFLGAGKGYIYSINTRVDEWDKGCLNRQLLTISARQPLTKTTRQVLTKTATPLATTLATPKESIKESINKDISKENTEKKQYGEFNNVLLTDEEYQKLITKLGKPKSDDLIEQLSGYMKQNPANAKKYVDHYAVVLNWSRRDGRKESPRNIPSKYTRPEDLNV